MCIPASHLLGHPVFTGEGLCSPVGSSAGTPRLTSCQQNRKQQGCGCTQANRRRKLYRFVCKICKYYDCFQSQGSNGTWYCPSRCALYSVLCCKLSIASLVDFVRTQTFFAVNFIYILGARWKDSKSNMTSVCLEKGPRSHRADTAQNDGLSLHLLRPLTSCGKSWYSEWGRRWGDAGKWFTLCQGRWDLAEHRQWFMRCMACRGMISLSMWGAWLQSEGSHSHFLEDGHQSGDWVPSFQWKSRTCVISENFSLCLGSSAAR